MAGAIDAVTGVGDRMIETERLKLAPQTLAEVRAMLDGMSPSDRAEVSPEWLALLDHPAAAAWTLGFAVIEQASGAAVGSCGFKGPPIDGAVEIAYSISPEYEGRGYGTEAAAALADHAAGADEVRVVRAHTRPGPNASTRVLEKCGFRCLGEVIDLEDGLVWRWERQ
jgi:[ribosomal protein S5]-alanine N-acetyltransferase